jgi:hypothetical protein
MPSLNFLNPQDVEKFRQTARSYGKSDEEIEKKILNRAKQQATLRELQSPSSQTTETQEEGRKALNAISLMEQKYFGGDLAEGRNILARGKRLGRGLFSGITGPTQQQQEIRSYKAMRDLAIPLINRAIGAGAPQKTELEALLKNIPDETSTEQEARDWFNTTKMLLSQNANLEMQTDMSTPSLSLGGEQATGVNIKPVLNLEGEVADVGDWTYNKESGVLQKVEDLPYDPDVFKTVKTVDEETGEEKSTGAIDSKLINFLANSEFLPIAGSITGGIFGGGLIGGAGGAMAGEAAKQGLLNLLNPNETSLTRSAQAVLTEGLVDAAFSGLTMGVGKIAGKGFGLIFKQGAKEGTEAIGKELLEAGMKEGIEKFGGEITEAGLKKAAGETMQTAGKELGDISTKEFIESSGGEFLERLMRETDGSTKGLSKWFENQGIRKIKNLYNITPKEDALFKKQFGVSVSEALLKFGDAGDLEKISKAAGIIKENNENTFKKLLTGKIKKDDAIKLIDDGIENAKKIAKGPEVSKGIKALEEYKEELLDLSKNNYIPDIELQKIKKGMADIAHDVSGHYASPKKAVIGAAERKIKEYLTEKYGKEYVGTNLKSRFTFLLDELGTEAIEKAKQKNALKDVLTIWDAALYGVNPTFFYTKKGYDVLSKALPEKHKTKFYQSAFKVLKNMPRTAQTKQRMRALLMGAMKDGIPMTVGEQTLKAGARGVSAFDLYEGLNSNPDKESMNKAKEQIQQNPSLNLGESKSLDQGGGMPSLKLTPSVDYDYKQLQSRPFLYK